MTTLKTWYISTYASRREWIKLKVCFFGGSIGKTCVLILSFKVIPENCISLESWKTQLSNDILNEGINVFCGPLRSKIEMTNVIANHFSRCGSRLVLMTIYYLKTILYVGSLRHIENHRGWPELSLLTFNPHPASIFPPHQSSHHLLLLSSLLLVLLLR